MENQKSDYQGSAIGKSSIANCLKHGPYHQKKHEVLGKIFTTSCPECSNEKDNAKELEKRETLQRIKNESIKRLLGDSGLPKRFQGRRFDNFTIENTEQKRSLKIAQFFAENFDSFLSTGASLVFCGKPGTGKTHLAASIANAICEQGRSALYLSVLKATRMVKDTWKRDANVSENNVYKAMITPDLLILDEVGIQFGSESEKLILFEILNGRYEEMRPTIVISNLLPSEITNYLGERVVDRLTEGGGSVVVFDWDSYRTKVLDNKLLPKAEVSPVDWNDSYRRMAE